MEDSCSDVLIIGAGPAGIACALRLLDNNFKGKIRIIESGRRYDHRLCHVDRMASCLGCGGKCNVISGFGGCMHYGDSVKLSKFPSGKRLLHHLPTESADDYVNDAIRRFDVDNLTFVENVVSAPFPVKSYPVAIVPSFQLRHSISEKYKRLSAAKNVFLHCETDVTRIEIKSTGEFDVFVNSNNNLFQHSSRRLVVATGRHGLFWWKKEVRNLGISFTAPVISIGIRFECPQELLSPIGSIHPDFKCSLEIDGHKIKTFCFCAGFGGGRIKFANYGPFTLLDGHIIPEPEYSNGASNFALLSQLRAKDGKPRSFQWVLENIIEKYKNLVPHRPGQPVLQHYSDFKMNTLNADTINQIYNRTAIKPSVGGFTVANLASIFTKHQHKLFCSSFESLIEYFATGNGNTANWLERTQVAGLELENLWDEILVDERMQSSIPNLFVIGDCAGMSQGILQAAITGIAAANSIA